MKDKIALWIVRKLHRLEIGFRLPRADKGVKGLLINTVLLFPPTTKPCKGTMFLLHLPGNKPLCLFFDFPCRSLAGATTAYPPAIPKWHKERFDRPTRATCPVQAFRWWVAWHDRLQEQIAEACHLSAFCLHMLPDRDNLVGRFSVFH